MSRRRSPGHPLLTVAPGAGLVYGWWHLGQPLHLAGLGVAGATGFLIMILMPGVIVSAAAVPLLLVPPGVVRWWRHCRKQPRHWTHPFREGTQSRPAIPARIRRAVLAADGYRCCWCGSGVQLQVDHVKPYAAGGLSAFWNFVTLCGPHNMVKSNYWVARDGYVFYRPWAGHSDEVLASQILAHEKWHRWSPLRWLRAGWSLGG